MGDTPGHRFGGGSGITPMISAGRFGMVNCELTYCRHRAREGKSTQPIGRVHIGYADGHVELKSNRELVNPITAVSTFDSLWTPRDRELDP
jgi:prepilin-type processing-associated H-X9-DG protein